jgi:uncharacterized protein with NRDE domain
MCLLVMALRSHPRFPFILATNRDEFLDRPAQPAHWWSDAPEILAGRDMQAGGTWLGMTQQGRFAMVTNYRDLRRPRTKGRSRGLLVLDALNGALHPGTDATYDGFNLLHGDLPRLRYTSNITGTTEEVGSGMHAMSNSLLDTPWPKVKRAIELFEPVVAVDEPSPDALFDLLRDDRRAAPQDLPDTGIDREWEEALSSIFIKTPTYGTRCSTVIMLDNRGHVRFEERSHLTGKHVRVDFHVQPLLAT